MAEGRRAALETKGLELRGTGGVVTPQAPFEPGKTEMAFPVVRVDNSEFRTGWGGAAGQREGQGH